YLDTWILGYLDTWILLARLPPCPPPPPSRRHDLRREPLAGAVDQATGDGRHDFVGHPHLWARGLGQHVTLVVHIIDQNKFTGLTESDLAGEELHSGQISQPADDLPQSRQPIFFDLLRLQRRITVCIAIPPTEPNCAEHMEDAK